MITSIASEEIALVLDTRCVQRVAVQDYAFDFNGIAIIDDAGHREVVDRCAVGTIIDYQCIDHEGHGAADVMAADNTVDFHDAVPGPIAAFNA